MNKKLDMIGDYVRHLEEENTELQQELKDAKDSITWWTNRFNAVQRDYENLQQRIDKAIKYIKKVNKYGVLEDTYAKDLLETLGEKE